MGVFVPVCIVQGGKSLYAFTVTRAYKERTNTKVYMLVKSNENPSHTLENLTWTPVSVISAQGFVEVQILGDSRGHNCAFDVDTGVFTLFYRDYSFLYNPTMTGIQYTPPGASGGNPQPPTNALVGSGTWRNVTFPPDYHWERIGHNRLTNYRDPQSNKTYLMHVVNNSTDIYVATLDPVTMTMKQGPSWTPSQMRDYHFSPQSINIISQNIYVMTQNVSLHDAVTLQQFPINGADPTSPPSQTTALNFNGTQTQCSGPTKAHILLNFRENPLMICEINPPTAISQVNGTELVILPGITAGGIDEWQTSVIEVVDMPPTVPYLIYQDMDNNIFTVALSGPYAGTKIFSKNMTVAEDYGDNAPPTVTNGSDGPISDWGSGLGKSGSKSSTGAIVGGVCAVVVVVIAVLGFMYYRRRRQLNNHQGIDKAKPNSSDSSSPTAAAAVTEPHLTQSWNQEPMQQVQPPPLQYLQDRLKVNARTKVKWEYRLQSVVVVSALAFVYCRRAYGNMKRVKDNDESNKILQPLNEQPKPLIPITKKPNTHHRSHFNKQRHNRRKHEN
ncbi:hypothetical protein BGX31_007662 [Mortierella sp. GBA43]|nr:hypothetical protein BGX31_007662 [Mortierella sp. GBA43]